ncbi:MAG TPA: universal stress protein [Acidimicrobiia bacterium]|jgi:nucleotide-binding universal stress UspA family protein
MHVLIATDGSDSSLNAAAHARSILGDAEWTLVCVIPPMESPEADAGGIEGPVLDPQEVVDMHRSGVVEADAALAATARALGPTPVEQRVEEGSAGTTICSLASKLDADVVVVGSHGKSALTETLLGSVGTYVVHHCEQPVLVVPPRE